MIATDLLLKYPEGNAVRAAAQQPVSLPCREGCEAWFLFTASCLSERAQQANICTGEHRVPGKPRCKQASDSVCEPRDICRQRSLQRKTLCA